MKYTDLTSEERVILIKDEQNKFLGKLDLAFDSLKKVIQERSGVAVVMQILGDINKIHGANIAPDITAVDCLIQEIGRGKLIVEANRAMTNIMVVPSEVAFLKSINQRNNEMVRSFKLRGFTAIAEMVTSFIDENKNDLFSVKVLKKTIEDEEAASQKAFDKALGKDKVETEPCIKVEEEVKPIPQENLEAAKLANTTFADLKDIQRDLPKTYAARDLCAHLCTKLDKLSNKYAFPVKPTEDLKVLRQAWFELDNLYSDVDKIKSVYNPVVW